jgi:hypothetical protein
VQASRLRLGGRRDACTTRIAQVICVRRLTSAGPCQQKLTTGFNSPRSPHLALLTLSHRANALDFGRSPLSDKAILPKAHLGTNTYGVQRLSALP